QSIGRQSAHGKSLKRLTELEQKELEIRYVRQRLYCWKSAKKFYGGGRKRRSNQNDKGMAI
ncbi:hypothetical protein P4I92_19145, partial [Bacillus cereus]